jgi:hypothetical protein
MDHFDLMHNNLWLEELEICCRELDLLVGGGESSEMGMKDLYTGIKDILC